MERLIKGLIFVGMVALALGIYAAVVNAQTPPISTISVPVDTIYGDQVILTVSVASDVDWDLGGGVGIYATTDPSSGSWDYLGYTFDEFVWTVPDDSRLYYLASSVANNLFTGPPDTVNTEGHEFKNRTTVYVCSGCVPPGVDCPPPSLLEATQVVAEFDPSAVSVETPMIEYYWTHYADPADSARSTIAVEYEAEWEVDGVVSVIPGIARGDSLHGRVEVPYTPGQTQRLRVRGFDAAQRPSIFSIWSEPFTDDGPPPQPGQASRRLILIGGQ